MDSGLAHSETLESLDRAITFLESQSTVRADIGKGSFKGLFSLDLNSMSVEEYLAGLRELSDLSPEDLAMLEWDRSLLNDLFLRVNQDQVTLLQILPPPDVSTVFHGIALATIETEIAVIQDLLRFYSSPGLQRKGTKFDEFPKVRWYPKTRQLAKRESSS